MKLPELNPKAAPHFVDAASCKAWLESVALATAALPLVLLNAVLLASGGDAQVAGPLLAALIVVLLPILFASFYASYRDVFGYHLPE